MEIILTLFCLGVFEAGFYPGMLLSKTLTTVPLTFDEGIIYFITMWYPVEERSLRIALVGSSASAAGAFSEPLLLTRST